jgi:uncharacterized protein YjiS (DUF1127 family)
MRHTAGQRPHQHETIMGTLAPQPADASAPAARSPKTRPRSETRVEAASSPDAGCANSRHAQEADLKGKAMSSIAISAGDPMRVAEMRKAVRAAVWAAIWRGLANAVSAYVAASGERRRVKRAIAELSGLSDRMLKDIGVTRSSIPRVARYGRSVPALRPPRR